MTSLRQRMTEDIEVRNLALNTPTSYLQQVSLFAPHFHKSPGQLGPEEIRTYQVRSTSLTKGSWPLVRFSLPSQPYAFSTRSRSNGNGLWMT